MTVFMLILSVVLCCILTYWLANSQKDRATNGFFLAVWLHEVVTNATKLLA